MSLNPTGLNILHEYSTASAGAQVVHMSVMGTQMQETGVLQT